MLGIKIIQNNRPGIQITLKPFYLHIRPMDPSHNYTEAEGDTTVEVEVQLPYPFNQSLLSSEEGEEDKGQEVTDLSWHPKPLGVSAETRGIAAPFLTMKVGLRFMLAASLYSFFNRYEYKLFQTDKIFFFQNYFFFFCSCAHLDAGHWVATSSPSTDAGNICGLPSVQCWSTTSARILYVEVSISNFVKCAKF